MSPERRQVQEHSNIVESRQELAIFDLLHKTLIDNPQRFGVFRGLREIPALESRVCVMQDNSVTELDMKIVCGEAHIQSAKRGQRSEIVAIRGSCTFINNEAQAVYSLMVHRAISDEGLSALRSFIVASDGSPDGQILVVSHSSASALSAPNVIDILHRPAEIVPCKSTRGTLADLDPDEQLRLTRWFSHDPLPPGELEELYRHPVTSRAKGPLAY